MLRKSIATLAFVLVPAAHGQVASVLLEACNAMSDAGKRLECLKAAVGDGPQKSPPSTEAVTRAFVGLQGSLNSGMSLISYQAAVQNVAQELEIYKRQAPADAGHAIKSLEEALETYGDASRFWDTAISFYARRDNNLAYSGGLPMKMVGLEWMLSKYALPRRNSDIWGFNVGVPTDTGRAYLWQKAQIDANYGMKLLSALGTPATPKAAEAANEWPKPPANLFTPNPSDPAIP